MFHVKHRFVRVLLSAVVVSNEKETRRIGFPWTPELVVRSRHSVGGTIDACRAALEMQQAIEALNTLRTSRGEPLLVTGIGINTGSVIAGGLGARDRLHYTIIGDTVNAAQRIEGLTRQLLNGSGVLISHATYTELEEDRSAFHIEALGVQTIKGRVERMMIYHLEERGSRPDLNMTF